MINKILLLCCISILSFTEILSQQTVTGTVTDENGNPLSGVTVSLKGTRNETVTDLNGNYSIDQPEEGGTLIFSFIDFETKKIDIHDQTVINIQLLKVSKQKILTTLGIVKEQEVLGYSVQMLNSEEITENKSIDVVTGLQGKIAGLHIAQTGTGIGSATNIQLRSIASLSQGQNTPLWIVDGVPIDNTSIKGDIELENGDDWFRNDFANAASEINPEDIESITVLKGANATALYGSRGLNGAIVITSKKAKENQPLTISYSGNFAFSDAYDFYELQDTYGRGTDGAYAANSRGSWGPKMTGQEVEHWRVYHYDDSSQGTTYQMLPQTNRSEDFYRRGINMTNSIVFAGGGKHASTRLSFSNSRRQGISPGHEIVTTSANLINTFKYNRWNLSTKVNFIRTEGTNRPRNGILSSQMNLLMMPMDISLESLRPEADPDNWQMNWYGSSNNVYNPYYVTHYDNVNNDTKNRIVSMANINFSITDWLKIASKTGFDYSAVTTESKRYNNFRQGGEYQYIKRDFYILNSDLMFMLDQSFNKIRFQTNLGAEIYLQKYDDLSAWTRFIDNIDVFSVEVGGLTTTDQTITENKIQSVFGDVILSYNNYLFINITGRNDWSSTLISDDEWSGFYPSVSLSGVLSDIVPLPDFTDFLKLRASWASFGNYNVYAPYHVSEGSDSVYIINNTDTIRMNDYLPEKTSSIEAGIDFSGLQNRLNLSFTLFNKTTESNNIEEMISSGFDLTMNVVPVSTGDFKWKLGLNFSKSTSEIVKLATIDTMDYRLQGALFNFNESDDYEKMAEIRLYEGQKYGEMYGIGYQKDASGNVLTDAQGLPLPESGYDTYLGNIMPDWMASISNTFIYKSFSLKALINIRKGGIVFSGTDALLTAYGNTPKTLDNRNSNAEAYWTLVGGDSPVGEEFVYDASYVKLGQLSLSYNIPSSVIEKIMVKQLKLSLVGSNLFYLTKNTPGNPEGAFNRMDWAQGFELGAIPSVRNYGINVNVKF